SSIRATGKLRARKALDTFVVHTPRWVDKAFWSELREELAQLVAHLAAADMERAREQIIDRVSAAAQAADNPQSPLFPIHVEVDNDESSDTTKLSIRSTNTPGFLFEFSGALALLGVDIQRVNIRTIHHEVHDIFWVTDTRGHKIVDSDRV